MQPIKYRMHADSAHQRDIMQDHIGKAEDHTVRHTERQIQIAQAAVSINCQNLLSTLGKRCANRSSE